MAGADMNPKRNPMPTQDAKTRAHNFLEVALGYTEEQAIAEAHRCLNCKNMPCVDGCPVKIHIPAFIEKIREGDFVEIFVENDGAIAFKKYSHLENVRHTISDYVMSANTSAQVKLLVVDKDKVVAGITKHIDKNISEEFDDIFSNNNLYCYNITKVLVHYGDNDYVKYAMPIVLNENVIGAVVCITDEENPEIDENSKEAMVTKLVASFINKFLKFE